MKYKCDECGNFPCICILPEGTVKPTGCLYPVDDTHADWQEVKDEKDN